MSALRRVVVRATPYSCTHTALGLTYWRHRAYELEIAGHGWTMAPSRRKVRKWALDWLACAYENEREEWEVSIVWS